MPDLNDPKTTLKEHLMSRREALLWTLEGLGERELRMDKPSRLAERFSTRP